MQFEGERLPGAILIRGRRPVIDVDIQGTSVVVTSPAGESWYRTSSMELRDTLLTLFTVGLPLDYKKLGLRHTTILRSIIVSSIERGFLEYVLIQDNRSLLVARARHYLRISQIETAWNQHVSVRPAGCLLIDHDGDDLRIISPIYGADVTIFGSFVSRLALALADRNSAQGPDIMAIGLLYCLHILEGRAAEGAASFGEHLYAFLHSLSRPPHVGLPVGGRVEPHEPTVSRNITSSTDRDLSILRTWYEGRRSDRKNSNAGLELSVLTSFFYPLLAAEEENGRSRRMFPAAGGFYDFGFFVISRKIKNVDIGILCVELSSSGELINYTPVACAMSDIRLACDEVASAWGVRGTQPDALVIVTFDGRRSVAKYGARSYRLALLNGGVLLGIMYDIARRLHLSCCAIGYGSQTLENMVARKYPGHSIIVEFALSAAE